MSNSSLPTHELKYQALADLRHLRRSALHSHLRRQVDDLADDTSLPLLAAFLPNNLSCWLGSYLKYAFHRKHPFVSYPETGERGLYRIADSAKIGIAGDWGTGTKEAEDVAKNLMAFNPDYTIHLGDVYYVGAATEVEENFLGKSEFGYQGLTWPKGRIGSFSMNGNHEMYANGNAYFDVLMPTLGIPGSQDARQLASFFCLENDNWRIIALDTAYNSTGLPVLAQIPLLNRLPHVGPDCQLEEASLEWLRTVVRPKERPRATILLTHHQYFSAFEDEYHLPAEQLMEFFAGQDLLWIWGHEHRWAVYDRHCAGSLTAYGRCVGHGGMPVEICAPTKLGQSSEPGKTGSDGSADSTPGLPPLQYFDERVYIDDGKTKIGMNGFLNLQIEGETVTLDHRDVNNKTVLLERFTAGKNGTLSQEMVQVDAQLSEGAAAPRLSLGKAAT